MIESGLTKVYNEWSEEMIQMTLDQWNPISLEKEGKELTRDDAIEILNNCVNLFEALAEIDQKQKKSYS